MAEAVLISNKDEEWLLSRIEKSRAKHLAFIPSHPFGYTAGKWREWYPDVVAEEGTTDTVANELLSEVKGSLTTNVNKYLWQQGKVNMIMILKSLHLVWKQHHS